MYPNRPINPTPFDIPTIHEVWADNLYQTFKIIRMIIKGNNQFYVAMDTEFPGVVRRQEFRERNNYHQIRDNCNCLRVIQVGLSLMDHGGPKSAESVATWQFNFKFNIDEDESAHESIEMLKNSGIPFEKLKTDGINWDDFGELCISSGLICSEDSRWLTFHGGSDMGYMYRIISGKYLPTTEREFIDELQIYFPNLYDIKYMAGHIRDPRVNCCGLQALASFLFVTRYGDAHQAGSDSLLTGQTFFALLEMYFGDTINNSLYNGRLYGLTESYFIEEEEDAAVPIPVVPFIPLVPIAQVLQPVVAVPVPILSPAAPVNPDLENRADA